MPEVTTPQTQSQAPVQTQTQSPAPPKPPMKKKDGRKKMVKRVVALGALLCFGLLYAMKYWNFTLELLPTPVAARLPRWDFLMPLGLSFFTFQAVGYVVDVYRGKAAQNNPVKYLLFVSFFPQMIQGPIGRYDALAPQLLAPKELSWQNLQYGIQLAMWGYFKKLVIADRAAVLVDTVIHDNCPYGGAVIAFGVLLGTIIIGCIYNGMNFLRIDSYYQSLTKGAVIILAVLLDMAMNKKNR